MIEAHEFLWEGFLSQKNQMDKSDILLNNMIGQTENIIIAPLQV